MVTVIADKEELTTSVNNGGVNGSSNDNERPFQYIKDYQEVDFHRSSSCKPLPEDLIDNQTEKSSIKGTFFVQIDSFEFLNNLSNNVQTNDNSSWILTLTDGIQTIKGITNDLIPELNFNIRPGCKLLLTGVIPIKNGLLQLNHDNTRFQYGSNTYPRPRSAYRGRGGGSYRTSYEGRRGSGNNSNNRYDNDDNETNFLKRPPPKTTLMAFMPTLNILNDSKSLNDNENQKIKQRKNPEHQINNHNDLNFYQNQLNNYSEQIQFQQDSIINEQFDSEDDLLHGNYRERRNPLPPRLQRVQEERTRRNTNRYHDETTTTTAELNGNSNNNNNHSLSSSTRCIAHDQTNYITNNSSNINSYTQHGNIIPNVNGSTQQTHLAYFQTNPGPLAYNLAGIPSPPFHNQPSYSNDHITFCYGTPYGPGTYVPVPNGFNNESKTNINSFIDENEIKQDESENKSQSSSSTTSSSSSSNDGNTNAQQQDNKRRDLNSNPPKPRWRVGDTCLARWNEDQEFYVATIVQIHPPCCTVLFRDYNNYDQVYFSDLKILPRDQQFYQFIPPINGPSSDLNALAASAYYPPRPNYYSSPIDGCIIMPEAPPFPFNSAGTLYMCPPTITSFQRSNRYSSYQNKQNDNEINTINSSSTPSKDSNDTSINDSTTISIDDIQQNLTSSCSINDKNLKLVNKDDNNDHERQYSASTVSQNHEQQSINENKQPVLDVN